MSETANPNRLTLHGAKMLCPVGCGMQRALFQNERDEVYLQCRHLRSPALLDKNTGCVGIEDRDSELGMVMFTPELPSYSNY